MNTTICMHGFRTSSCATCALRSASKCDFGACWSTAKLRLTICNSSGQALEARSCCRKHEQPMRASFGARGGETINCRKLL
jgi:hypothetical protein